MFRRTNRMSVVIDFVCDICGLRIIEGCDGVAYSKDSDKWFSSFTLENDQKHICEKCITKATQAMGDVIK